jgi:hypothetical protein
MAAHCRYPHLSRACFPACVKTNGDRLTLDNTDTLFSIGSTNPPATSLA